MGMFGAARGAGSEKKVDEDSEGLRDSDGAAMVVEPEGREISLEKEAVLSVALLERRRLKGLR